MGVEMILPDVGPGNKRGLGFSCGGRVCGCGLVGGSFLGSGEGCGRPIRGVHTLGDWPVVPTGEVDKGEGGGGDGRSRTVAQEDGDACTDG